MYNSNGPPKGFNVTSDQSSYDLVSKDIIVCSNNGTPSSGSVSGTNTSYIFNIGIDNMNNIYKAELVSAAVKFNGTSIPANVQNQTLLVSIPQLNQNTFQIASNNGANGYGTNTIQSQIFCQIPDNYTPISIAGQTSNTISLYIGGRMFDTVQYYNPPINKINKLEVSMFDPTGVVIPVTSNTNTEPGIASFYFTLRVYYFQKRNNTSSFSTSVFNYAGSGTVDSIYQPTM